MVRLNYLRNDVLDANDWFADSRGLSKPRDGRMILADVQRSDSQGSYVFLLFL